MLRFIKLLSLLIFASLIAAPVFASTTDGTVTGSAWSDQIGWVNFGTTNGNIHITDSVVTGYAWNENTGRINLNPTNSGVLNNAEGTLSGYAWAEGTGWINFSGVTINSSGAFAGTATGDNSVTIYFSCSNCNVSTDWRPASSRTAETPAAGGPGPVQDITAPEIKIIYIKDKYTTDEEILVAGTTEPKAEITVLFGEEYGSFLADAQGNWYVTLGKLQEHSYHLEFTAKDLAGNIGKPAMADFLVVLPEKPVSVLPEENPTFKLAPPLESILRQLEEGIKPFIPKFLQPAQKPAPKPVVIKIPKIAQLSLGGKWLLLPEKPITRFALAPLPNEVALLAQKFPKVGETFQEVGITKVTDLQKLKNSKLSLPGLTETLGLAPTNVTPGKLALVKGVPIAQLSSVAKSKIPLGVVFSKAAGGLVDFNVALSVNNKGQTEQRIQTLVNNPLQLVVKPDAPVKRVRGYIVFRSRHPSQIKTSDQTASNVKLGDLTLSSIFSNPEILQPAALSAPIVVDGATLSSRGGSQADMAIQIESTNSVPATDSGLPRSPDGLARNDTAGGVETRLVMAEFDYVDSGSGVYTATVQTPVVDGEYEIITVIEYKDEKIYSKEIKLITVVDPEGYIYEKSGDKETRIVGAVASLYWLNPSTKQYELWPAKNFQQENPQTTDVRGTYSFLVPEGYYYLKVEAPGYLSYDGKPFQVTEGSGIHINVQLKTTFWFLNILDWKTFLLIIVILMLAYNFYKDKRRERQPAAANV